MLKLTIQVNWKVRFGKLMRNFICDNISFFIRLFTSAQRAVSLESVITGAHAEEEEM